MTPLDYEYLRKFLKDRSGLDLSSDKQYLVESRLIPVARKVGLSGISDLVARMRAGSEETISTVVEAMPVPYSRRSGRQVVRTTGGTGNAFEQLIRILTRYG